MNKKIVLIGVFLIGFISIAVAQNHIKTVPPVELDTKEVKIVEGNIMPLVTSAQIEEIYYALPKGNCDVTITQVGNGVDTVLSRAKNNMVSADAVTCKAINTKNSCSGAFDITPEYYLLKIKMVGGGYLYNIAYQCKS